MLGKDQNLGADQTEGTARQPLKLFENLPLFDAETAARVMQDIARFQNLITGGVGLTRVEI